MNVQNNSLLFPTGFLGSGRPGGFTEAAMTPLIPS